MTDSKDKKEYSWEELKDLVKLWNNHSDSDKGKDGNDGDTEKYSVVEN